MPRRIHHKIRKRHHAVRLVHTSTIPRRHRHTAKPFTHPLPKRVNNRHMPTNRLRLPTPPSPVTNASTRYHTPIQRRIKKRVLVPLRQHRAFLSQHATHAHRQHQLSIRKMPKQRAHRPSANRNLNTITLNNTLTLTKRHPKRTLIKPEHPAIQHTNPSPIPPNKVGRRTRRQPSKPRINQLPTTHNTIPHQPTRPITSNINHRLTTPSPPPNPHPPATSIEAPQTSPNPPRKPYGLLIPLFRHLPPPPCLPNLRQSPIFTQTSRHQPNNRTESHVSTTPHSYEHNTPLRSRSFPHFPTPVVLANPKGTTKTARRRPDGHAQAFPPPLRGSVSLPGQIGRAHV